MVIFLQSYIVIDINTTDSEYSIPDTSVLYIVFIYTAMLNYMLFSIYFSIYFVHR